MVVGLGRHGALDVCGIVMYCEKRARAFKQKRKRGEVSRGQKDRLVSSGFFFFIKYSKSRGEYCQITIVSVRRFPKSQTWEASITYGFIPLSKREKVGFQ